ncbi:DNA invertase Pin-like site-specific DNA recombinase [Pseudomonas sp. SJZ103]|uniref:recombinase family protein n=1 Tax=unclassified Pseudomonas TaxID=196821 RepID=UPI0011A6BC0B|nr:MULTISPECIES: recombinase family protein [unclassified Pseudomonas]TWC67948.1 DNA invertase Pin-like site-specific DNA recombinase [Pseudomonas sp. SJZ103]TWC84882.1 DNA invertase Pin-like site-specific DNA recombinase [Pseudomonas sp. SJZ094]
MRSAIPYIRFSSARQTTGSSAERQQQMVTQWLTKHPEYTLSDLTYKDFGKSGYHGEHVKDGGGFAKLLAAVEAGDIKAGDVVLVEAIDRTGRLHPLDMLNKVITPILAAGVSIITLDDKVTYTHESAASGHLFLLVAKIQAAYGYSKQLSERTKASYAIRLEQAKEGNKVKRNTPVWLHSDGRLNDDVTPYIKQAFELYVSGVGKTAIANRLRASGVPELVKCSGPTVEAWLRNQAAIGNWEYGKDDPDKPSQIIFGVYPPVISNELFLQAQHRKSAVATKPRERTSKNFLVGIVKCGVCGANLIIHNKDGKPNNMRCLTHHRLKDAGCTNKETIPYQVVHFIYLQTAPSWVDRAMKIVQLSENDKRKLHLAGEREELTKSIERLVKLSAVGDSVELEAQYKLAIGRRTEIDNELEILSRKAGGVVVESNPNSIFFGYDAKVEHDRLVIHDPVQLSALLKQAGYSITLQPGRKLYLADSETPWVYTGVARKGNATLGFRIQHGDYEFTISNIIPEVVDANVYDSDPIGELKHLAERSYKHVKPIKSLKTGLSIKIMIVDEHGNEVF